MKFSILTATYNRAGYLEKLYKSLVDNIDKEYEIEWLIMDDGSTDNTQEVCKFFVNKEGLFVQYERQENQGKMVAINNLVKKATGDFVIECDSDDYFTPNALKKVAKKCKILRGNDNLYAMVFLKNENPSKLSGNRFPFENIDTTMFDLYFKHNLDGEKILVYKSEIRKKYKYIMEPGEKFCTEARMMHQIDLKYKVRCYNEVIIEGEYQPDGYTKNIKKIFMENPNGHYMYFKEILENGTEGITFNKRLYVIKHYIMFSVIAKKEKNLKNIKCLCDKILFILLLLPGKIKTKKYIKNA